MLCFGSVLFNFLVALCSNYVDILLESGLVFLFLFSMLALKLGSASSCCWVLGLIDIFFQLSVILCHLLIASLSCFIPFSRCSDLLSLLSCSIQIEFT